MYQVPGTRYTTLSLNVRTVCILIVIQNRVFRDRVAWELLKVPVMYLVPGGTWHGNFAVIQSCTGTYFRRLPGPRYNQRNGTGRVSM